MGDVSNSDVQILVFTTAILTVIIVPIAVILVRYWETPKSSEISQLQQIKFASKTVLNESAHPTSLTLTGKSKHSSITLGLSMFAGYMGAWVLTGPVEVGYETGMWGVVLYCTACVIPLLTFLIIGPQIRKLSKLYGFSIIDFSGARFGRGIEILLSILAFLILFFSNISDYLALNGIVYEMSTSATEGWIVTDMVTVAVCCTIYSILGGFAASLYTDVAQASIIFILTIVLSSLLVPLQNEASDESLDSSTSWNQSGVIAGLVLNLSCFLVTYADNSFWQKFYAAKSDSTYAKASLICCALYVPVIFLFGYFGCIAKALTDDDIIPEAEWHGNSIFTMVTYADSSALSICVLLMGTLCVMSSVDNRILASGNLIGQALTNRKLNLNYTRLLGFVASFFAILAAVFQPASIMQVLYCGNLLGCITAPVLLMSSWRPATSLGAWAGCISAALTTCIFGWTYLGTFVGGFQWWIFPMGYYDVSCLYTFLGVILAAFASIIGVSYLDRLVLRKEVFANQSADEINHLLMAKKLDAFEKAEEISMSSTSEDDDLPYYVGNLSSSQHETNSRIATAEII